VSFTQKLLETTQVGLSFLLSLPLLLLAHSSSPFPPFYLHDSYGSLTLPQVSQSVIVLALHYIHRLRQRNAGTPAQPGSEFRVAVAGLMMANKFLDE
jgi:hypothetical protein